MENYTLATCLDIFDWFDAPEFDDLMDIYLYEADGEKQLLRVLPELQRQAQALVETYKGTLRAYPETDEQLDAQIAAERVC